MKKLYIIYMISTLLIGIVYALDECGESVPVNERCSILSPYISYCPAYTVNVSFSNGTIFKDSGVLAQVASTGIYNYTINFTVADTYIVKLCDDSVRSIVALDTSATAPSTSWWSYLLQIYYNTLPGGY